jgi:dTDP-4-amino-4,6-dideoxygalactose transaminase
MLYCGATPRFSDIQWNTWNIDPVAIIKGIGVKTKVLIPVDFAGLPCDLEEIRKIADEHRLIVIEDACHALGASYKGKKIGGSGFSDMTVFSFHPVKHITTGEGGAVLTDDAVLAKRLRKLRHHGITKDPAEMRENHGPWYYEIQELGYNARITDIQCGLGLSQLKNLDNFLVRRREIATRYREWFSAIPGLTVQGESRGSVNAFHLFVVHLDPSVYCRKTVFETLVLEGVNPQVHYIPLHLQPAYKQSTGCDCVMANHYYTGAISLPMYPALTDKDLRTVWDAFNIAVKAGRL